MWPVRISAAVLDLRTDRCDLAKLRTAEAVSFALNLQLFELKEVGQAAFNSG